MDLNQITIGHPLPDWSLEPIFDIPPIPKDFVGAPLVILFFSLGCPGCLGRAVPYANRLVYEHGDQLKVLGIHTNFEGVDYELDKFTQAQSELNIRFPIYKDANFNTTYLDYGAGGTPHWIIVNAEGHVVYSIFGSDPNNALLRIDYLLGELLD